MQGTPNSKSEIQKLPFLDFLSFCDELRNRDGEQLAMEAIKLRCRSDLKLFSIIFFPHYCKKPFNLFHEDYFGFAADSRRNLRRAFAAPRGSAKSTLISLIKPIHDLCYQLETYILLISNTETQALGKLKDIRSELLTNDLLISTFGPFFKEKKISESQFIAISNGNECMFQAFGSGAEIRGVRFRQSRPSKIICDAVEHSEEVYNESIRSKYEQWYYEVVTKAGDENTNIETVGTILHRDSLLSKLLRNPSYSSRTYKSVIRWSEREDLWERWRMIFTNLDDEQRYERAQEFYEEYKAELLKSVQVLWPEKESYLHLMCELIEIGKRAFFKEKQNEPLGADNRIFDRIHWYRETSEGLLVESSGAVVPWSEIKNSCYGAVDPATGQSKIGKGKSGDYTSLVTGFKDRKGRLFVHDVWMQRASPTKFISEIFEHHSKYGYEKFAVETNLYRDLLTENLSAERKRREQSSGGQLLKIPFYDVQQTENKQERIFRLEPKVSHGYVLFNRALVQEAKSQLEDFPHADHDDFPDSVELLYNLVFNRNKPGPLNLTSLSRR